MISKFYCNRLLTCSCVTITYSVCVNSGGVVETSDVCLDCPTVIDRDVDLNRLLHRCLEKKAARCWMLLFLFYFFLFCCRCPCSRKVGGLSQRRDIILRTLLWGFVLRRYIAVVTTDSIEEEVVLSRESCSRMFSGFFFKWCWRLLLYQEGEWGKKWWASGFWKVSVDPFQRHVRSNTIVSTGSSWSLGGFTWDLQPRVALLKTPLLSRAASRAHKHKKS